MSSSVWTKGLKLGGLGALLFLAGCVAPLEQSEVKEQVKQDLGKIFADQEPIKGPLTLHQAMARALAYNLDSRQYAYEQAVANRQYDLSLFDLMPAMDGSAGLTGRTAKDASNSETLSTGERGDASYSEDTERFTSDLGVVFSLLDFGVSYVSSRQAANQALIAEQRRRLVRHTIIQDVRGAYWRALAAQRLMDRLPPLMERVAQAREQAETIAAQRLGSPLEALTYKRALLEIQRQLEGQRQDMVLAETELSSLISAPMAGTLDLADPGFEDDLPDAPLSMPAMEELALTHRPELLEEHYQARITRDETRKAILRLLPGIELDAAYNFDTNSFLLNNHWATYGAKISINLFRLIQGPSAINAAQAGEDVAEARRLALSMAVLTQVHVARVNFEEAKRRYETAQELFEVEEGILEQLKAEYAAGRQGDLAVIRGELNLVRAELTRDLSYAQVHNAYGRMFQVMGADPVPDSVPAEDLDGLAKAVAQVQADWRAGRVTLPGMDGPMPSPAPSDAGAAVSSAVTVPPMTREVAANTVTPTQGPRTRETVNGLAVIPGG